MNLCRCNQEVFEQLFQMQVVLPVTAKFRADASELAFFMEDLLRRQNRGSHDLARLGATCRLAPARVGFSVQEHTWLQDNVDPPFTGWVANLSQRATHMPPTPHIAALLKNSHLYIFGLSRPALPSEHFELQGWNLYGDPNLGPGADLRRAVQNLLPTHQQAISGNGMHPHVLGSVLLFLMSHVRRLEWEDSAQGQCEI